MLIFGIANLFRTRTICIQEIETQKLLRSNRNVHAQESVDLIDKNLTTTRFIIAVNRLSV
jgi:hypothetical protein